MGNRINRRIAHGLLALLAVGLVTNVCITAAVRDARGPDLVDRATLITDTSGWATDGGYQWTSDHTIAGVAYVYPMPQPARSFPPHSDPPLGLTMFHLDTTTGRLQQDKKAFSHTYPDGWARNHLMRSGPDIIISPDGMHVAQRVPMEADPDKVLTFDLRGPRKPVTEHAPARALLQWTADGRRLAQGSAPSMYTHILTMASPGPHTLVVATTEGGAVEIRRQTDGRPDELLGTLPEHERWYMTGIGISGDGTRVCWTEESRDRSAFRDWLMHDDGKGITTSHVALWAARSDGSRAHRIGSLWGSSAHRNSMNGVDSWMDCRFVPGNRKISFVWDGMLYVVPAE